MNRTTRFAATRAAALPLPPKYSWRHVVTFEETNLVGNVYYVRHIAWQGKCREMFLRDHAPSVLDDLSRDLRLVTLTCSCDYFAELAAFDEVEVRMSLDQIIQNRISVVFDYWRLSPGTPLMVAKGKQDLACMRFEVGKLKPVPPPEALSKALTAYGRLHEL